MASPFLGPYEPVKRNGDLKELRWAKPGQSTDEHRPLSVSVSLFFHASGWTCVGGMPRTCELPGATTNPWNSRDWFRHGASQWPAASSSPRTTWHYGAACNLIPRAASWRLAPYPERRQNIPFHFEASGLSAGNRPGCRRFWPWRLGAAVHASCQDFIGRCEKPATTNKNRSQGESLRAVRSQGRPRKVLLDDKAGPFSSEPSSL